MTINVECPCCNSRFILQSELLGKSMRCPTCKEIFTVETINAPVAAPDNLPESAPTTEGTGGSAGRADAPAPKYQTGSINDFLPVLESTAEVEPEPIILEIFEEDEPAEKPILPNVIPLLQGVEILSDWQSDDAEVKQTPSSKIPAKSPTRAKTDNKPAVASPMIEVEEAQIVEPPQDSPKEVVWSETLVPPPKEIVWSAETSDPSGPGVLRSEDTELVDVPDDERWERESEREDNEEEEGYRPRRRRSRGRKALLIVGILAIVAALGSGGYLIQQYFANQPQKIFEHAKLEYKNAHYEPAMKLFDEIVTKHADFPDYNEAKFFKELSSLRMTVASVGVVSNPKPAQQQLDNFIVQLADPAMQPFGQRFSLDIWETVNRFADATMTKAQDVFKEDDFKESEEWLNETAMLKPLIARFRSKDLQDEEPVFARVEEFRASKIEKARFRQSELVAYRNILQPDPDDDKIVEIRTRAKDAGLAQDAKVVALLGEAEKQIRDRWDYKNYANPIPPTGLAEPSNIGLLFAARLDPPNENRPAPAPGPGSVFFAVARGLLYALDENDGHVLWATRVGIDSTALPKQITVGLETIALVAVNDGTRSSLTARDARTGRAIWSQPLPAPTLGQPIVMGQRIYVPISEKRVKAGEPIRHDEQGMVLEIGLIDGYLLGKLALGRPLGSGGVGQPASGLLFLPAEARGIYVFDVEKKSADGKREKPELLGIVATEHPAGTLRAEPILTNADPEALGPRYLIVNQADGLNEMKLRAFPFPAPGTPQLPSAAAIDIALQGWSWFPPHCDTEKLSVVTDRGEFGLFGINQDRNNDSALFLIPPVPYFVAEADRPSRGQVAYADESSFWILARNHLQQIKIGFDAAHGLTLVPTGEPRTLGEPLHSAQLNARKDTVLVVTQVPGSGSCRATAFDPNTGQLRWQHQLGLLAQGAPLSFGDFIVLLDQDAGLYRIDSKSLLKPTESEWLINDNWLVGQPLLNVTYPPMMFPQADGKTIVVLTSIAAAKGPRLMVRTYSPDTGTQDRELPLTSPLAGNAIIQNGMLIFPLANGLLHRVRIADGKAMEAGPTWRGARLGHTAKCRLTALHDDDFLATDGNRTVQRWRWPVNQDGFESVGRIMLPEAIASTPLYFAEVNQHRLVLTDTKGNITLWDAENMGPNAGPLRSWRPTAKGPIPPGPLTTAPFLQTDLQGRHRIEFMVQGADLICLAPDQIEPVWVHVPESRTPGDSVLGQPQHANGRIYLTGRSGSYRAIDEETGKDLGEIYRTLGTATAAGQASPFRGGRLLAPLTDGTILLIAPPKKVVLPFMLIPIGPLGIPFVPIPVPVE